MSRGGALSERTLVLAPTGRDAAIAATILAEAGAHTLVCTDLAGLLAAMEVGGSLTVATANVVRADLARELRTRRPLTPILFVTGYADADALMDVGTDLIVHKPFSQAELARKVSASLALA